MLRRSESRLRRLAIAGQLLLTLVLAIWLVIANPARAATEAPAVPPATSTEAAPSAPAAAAPVEATAKYVLKVPATVTQQKIQLRPPATKLRVTTKPGDVAVQCGDRYQTYTCAGGKSFAIEREPTQAVSQFKVQNPTHQETILVELTIYATAEQSDM